VTIPLDGTFLDKNKEFVPSPLPNLPAVVPGGKDIQVLISEHSVQSFLTAYHKTGKFHMVQRDVPSDIINMVFDNFNNVFGTSKKIIIDISSDDATPGLTITSTKTQVDLGAIISVKNPMN